jgi:cysteine-rich repeat protein
MCVVVALAACAPESNDVVAVTDSPVREDGGTAGEENGNVNNLPDCDAPECVNSPSCQPACGNGELDPGEECDDGNTVDADGCEADCTIPRCGNAIRDPGEECDDGNTVGGDLCEADCTIPRCGNNIQDPGEECDDGNRIDGDRCESNCMAARCGNSIKDAGEHCDDGNLVNGDGCDNRCAASTAVYIKASNTRADHQFGFALAISADGATVAVGAYLEDSAATGVDGDQSDTSAPLAGAVYVFTWNGTAWGQEAYLKASNAQAFDMFGAKVALSADGSTLAVGAIGESSAATGINGDQSDDSATAAGAVYIFQRTGITWQQEAYIKASNTGASDQLGAGLALSADGSTLAVGAVGEASAATGIDRNQASNSAPFSGAVYVFTRTGSTWEQQGYIKASNTGASDAFGTSVALSGNGSMLAVGAVNESSSARGINGNQASNAATSAGAAYVFTHDGAGWHQQAYVKASNTGAADGFGGSIALSLDGSTMAVGASGEDSSAKGINGNQNSNAALESGAVYVFTRTGPEWTQQAYVKASNTGITDQFGWEVALSADGSMMAVGADAEDSGATGIGGNQNDNSATFAGAGYMFRRDGTTWHQQAYIKPINTSFGYQFGWSIALASDGTLAVGAPTESGAAPGVGGDPFDQNASSSGAVFIYK